MTAQTPEETKACCAAAYGSDVATLLLGDSYHPGGLGLTRRLAGRLDQAAGARVLDVAAGRGTTAMLLARELGLRVDGIELSPANVALARGAAEAAGLAADVTFAVGDAERLPYPDGTFDAAVVECALSTFPDKATAVGEIARVMRDGGRLGITDVVIEPGRMPPELATLSARAACIADALPLAGYAELLQAAGLHVSVTERHDAAVARMIDQIGARLTLARLVAPDRVEEFGLDRERAETMLTAARRAVGDGILGYGLLIAKKRGGGVGGPGCRGSGWSRPS